MYDTIIKIGNSQVQHGPRNNRIYLMNLDEEDMPEILNTIDHMATTYEYTKIFAKVPGVFSKDFLDNGYVVEATVPLFFNGERDCLFMGKYKDKGRSSPVDEDKNQKVVETAYLKRPINVAIPLEYEELPSEFVFKKAAVGDAKKMSELYSKVFDSYPFPIFDPEYIKETMDHDVLYFSIWKEDEIVALSACEVYIDDESVEMTDFAVLPQYRGYNFSYFLLMEMEKQMKENKIKTAYTIARSQSYGMNSSFAKCGYGFTGVLVKNTQIGGNIEDMNVWFKSLE